ncbi:MAG: T9SS type A sorting domain-containing protein [Bacteroidota bacterium]
MKSPLLFTRLATAIFLLSASLYLSAQTAVFSEDFAGFSTGTHSSPSTHDLSASLDTKTSVPGWTGYKVYSAAGEIKLGTADVPGWIETPEIDFAGHEGDLFVKFNIARWPDDASVVRVMLNGSQIGNDIAPGNDFQTIDIPVTDGITSGKVRFESLAKRFYLDNIRVVAQYPTGNEVAAVEKVKIRIYPNPAAGVVVIDNILFYDRLEVHSISGRLIESVELLDNMSIEYSMSGYDRGLYLFRFLSQSTVFTVKVAKY